MRQIITLCGTNRPGNFTGKALAVVEDELRTHPLELTSFHAAELQLDFPGRPPTEDAQRLKEAASAASGIVIATPEYHGGYSAMTKLMIENLGFPSALGGKPVALLGVAAGRIGAIKSLEQLRGVCSHTGAIVLPGSVSIAGVQQAFDAEGRCTDEAVEGALRGLGTALLEFIKDYVCPKHALEALVRGEGAPWVAEV